MKYSPIKLSRPYPLDALLVEKLQESTGQNEVTSYCKQVLLNYSESLKNSLAESKFSRTILTLKKAIHSYSQQVFEVVICDIMDEIMGNLAELEKGKALPKEGLPEDILLYISRYSDSQYAAKWKYMLMLHSHPSIIISDDKYFKKVISENNTTHHESESLANAIVAINKAACQVSLNEYTKRSTKNALNLMRQCSFRELSLRSMLNISMYDMFIDEYTVSDAILLLSETARLETLSLATNDLFGQDNLDNMASLHGRQGMANRWAAYREVFNYGKAIEIAEKKWAAGEQCFHNEMAKFLQSKEEFHNLTLSTLTKKLAPIARRYGKVWGERKQKKQQI